jgi:catechol 2,3-dioxygenase-like lactoylglutathione lyase family enzyme
MGLQTLDHYSVRTADVAATQSFYETVLGLRAGARPPFPFPGAWLYAGERPLVHVIGIDPADQQGLQAYLGARPEGSPAANTGALDHIAFTAADLPGMRERLARLGIAARERAVPGLGLQQVFVTDPNGVVIELNFPLAETV